MGAEMGEAPTATGAIDLSQGAAIRPNELLTEIDRIEGDRESVCDV